MRKIQQQEYRHNNYLFYEDNGEEGGTALDQLDRFIDDLNDEAVSLTNTERINAIEALIDAYYDFTGINPPPSALYRLADVMLSDDLRDSRKNKVAVTEYPFLSARQVERRLNRELSSSYWIVNMNTTEFTTGFKTSFYEDDDGTFRLTRQAVFSGRPY